MGMMFSVIGSGVVGLCVASELTARGANVHLFDRHEVIGPHACSWWAGGMLAPYCEGETAPEIVTRLGLNSANWWQAQGVQVTRNGSLVIALGRDARELDRFARRTREHRMLSADELGALEPDLHGRFARALHFPTEAHLSPRDALQTLVLNLQSRGVEIAMETGPGDGTIIDCRGLGARDALHDLRGVKGEMLVLKCADIKLSRAVRLLHPRIPIYLVPRGDGVYMLGATQIESADRSRATVRSVLELLSAAFALHPAFGEAEILEIGVDARPAFPDNVPRIRRIENKIYANGLFRHGFLLAPALARMVAAHVLDGIIPELMNENHS
jgi:glycine oxidase